MFIQCYRAAWDEAAPVLFSACPCQHPGILQGLRDMPRNASGWAQRGLSGAQHCCSKACLPWALLDKDHTFSSQPLLSSLCWRKSTQKEVPNLSPYLPSYNLSSYLLSYNRICCHITAHHIYRRVMAHRIYCSVTSQHVTVIISHCMYYRVTSHRVYRRVTSHPIFCRVTSHRIYRRVISHLIYCHVTFHRVCLPVTSHHIYRPAHARSCRAPVGSVPSYCLRLIASAHLVTSPAVHLPLSLWWLSLLSPASQIIPLPPWPGHSSQHPHVWKLFPF